MPRTLRVLLGIAIPLAVLSLGCATAPRTGPSLRAVLAAQEFSFPGGTVKNGRIHVDSGVKVEENPTTKTVFLRPASGAGAGFNVKCECFIEGGGFCFVVVHRNPDGSVDIDCASGGCGEEVALCTREITGDSFRWRFVARAAP